MSEGEGRAAAGAAEPVGAAPADKTPGIATPLNVVLAGVGGQGVLLVSRLLCGAAVKAGLKVQALEEHGMAQRGGAVTTQLRLAHSPIHTPEIRPGTGHLLLAFEPMEGLRALELLSPEATLLVNTRQLPPPPLPSLPPQPLADKAPTRLDMAEVEGLLKERFPPSRCHLFDATALAEAAGSTLAVNMVLLGAAAAVEVLPAALSREALELAIGEWVSPGMVEVNVRAFEAGYEAIATASPSPSQDTASNQKNGPV